MKSASEISEFYKALGDETRIKLLRILASHETLCVGMLARKLGITQSAVSQHLKVLKNRGIVEGKRMGFHIHYRIHVDVFDEFGLCSGLLIRKKAGKCANGEACVMKPVK
jgi:ArsR family transcriptional regulator, arsenate/arsenite/antimonite-responsive transcriptional repressor